MFVCVRLCSSVFVCVLRVRWCGVSCVCLFCVYVLILVRCVVRGVVRDVVRVCDSVFVHVCVRVCSSVSVRLCVFKGLCVCVCVCVQGCM